MLRLEQFRGEVLERVERIDRRANQIELRIVRIEQRVDDVAERLARLHLDVTARLDCIRDLLSAVETAQGSSFALGPADGIAGRRMS